MFTRTQAATSIDVLIDRVNALATDFQAVSATFRNVFGSAEGEEALQDMVGNLRTVTADLRDMVETNTDGIDRIVTNLDAFSSDLKDMTASDTGTFRLMIENLHATSQKLNRTLDGLAEISARVERGEGTLGKLLSDEELYEEAKAAIGDVRAALHEVRRAAEETQEQIPATILTTVFGSLF